MNSSLHEMKTIVCNKCLEVIHEKQYYGCDARTWHKRCLTCQMCHAFNPENEFRLYSVGNECLVCFQCYQKLRNNCKVCQQLIQKDEVFYRTQHHHCCIHAKCMSCARCRRSLETGDKYVIFGETNQMNCQLICQKCCQQQSSFTTSTTAATPTPTTNGGRRGRKRATH